MIYRHGLLFLTVIHLADMRLNNSIAHKWRFLPSLLGPEWDYKSTEWWYVISDVVICHHVICLWSTRHDKINEFSLFGVTTWFQQPCLPSAESACAVERDHIHGTESPPLCRKQFAITMTRDILQTAIINLQCFPNIGSEIADTIERDLVPLVYGNKPASWLKANLKCWVDAPKTSHSVSQQLWTMPEVWHLGSNECPPCKLRNNEACESLSDRKGCALEAQYFIRLRC